MPQVDRAALCAGIANIMIEECHGQTLGKRSDARGHAARATLLHQGEPRGRGHAGFALAVQPVSAETIITDTNGLDAGMVQVKTEDRMVPAYRARPAGGGKVPVIVVIQEIFGVHEHIKDMCRRLAKLGYYAIATDLYSRIGDATQISDIPTLISTIVSKAPDDAGCVRSRRNGRLRDGGGRRHLEARRDRLLLGRPADLALRRA